MSLININYFVAWNDKIISDFTMHSKNLAETIYSLIKHERYYQSLKNLELFYSDIFSIDNRDIQVFPVFICSLDEQSNIIGFINAKIAFEVADIEYIWVHENHRKNGLAHQLFYLFEKHCKENKSSLIEKIMLEVGEKNLNAISLYFKLGFNQISSRKNYYHENETALIFEKILLSIY